MSTITQNAIRTSVFAALRSELDIVTDGLTDETRLEADLDIDSQDLIAIIAAVLGHNYPDSKALKHITTIGDLVAFLTNSQHV